MTDTIELENGALRYWVRGDGPPLVLLATLAGTWLRQTTTLSKHFTVITYDVRGYGESPSATGFPSNPEHADDLAHLITALGFPRAHVIGLSQGGMISQYFAVRHPDLVDKLGLVATHAKAKDVTGLFLRMLTGFLERDDLENFWEVLKAFLFSAENSERVLRHEKLLREAVFNRYTAKSLHSIYDEVLRHDSTGWLKDITAPTLVVAGRDDMLYGPPIATEISARIPGARLQLLPAAHVPPVETPQLFSQLVIDFFSS